MALGPLIVISGLPGSGKTSLARQLAPELGWPLLSKDDVKEALFDVLGTGDLEYASRLSRAAHVAMYTLARTMPTAILEAFFQPGMAEKDLEGLGRDFIQVHCVCPVEVALDRYRRRVADPDRHWGHLPEHQPSDPHWATSTPQPLALDGPLIQIDTTEPVDLPTLVKAVRSATDVRIT